MSWNTGELLARTCKQTTISDSQSCILTYFEFVVHPWVFPGLYVISGTGSSQLLQVRQKSMKIDGIIHPHARLMVNHNLPIEELRSQVERWTTSSLSIDFISHSVCSFWELVGSLTLAPHLGYTILPSFRIRFKMCSIMMVCIRLVWLCADAVWTFLTWLFWPLP